MNETLHWISDYNKYESVLEVPEPKKQIRICKFLAIISKKSFDIYDMIKDYYCFPKQKIFVEFDGPCKSYRLRDSDSGIS